MFPRDKQGFAIDGQYFIGSSGLLIKPVTDPGVEKTEVYLPEDQVCADDFFLMPR
jgi:alpha 1,3-glucosidase